MEGNGLAGRRKAMTEERQANSGVGGGQKWGEDV